MVRHQGISKIEEADERIRHAFESAFFDDIAPAIEKALVYPEDLSLVERGLLRQIDDLLGLLDRIAGSSSAKHFSSICRRDAGLEKWAGDLIRRQSHIILRRYLPIKFENLAKQCGFERQPVHAAVYGTLMRGEYNSVDRCVLSTFKRIGQCEIPGTLYDVGRNQRYPGLVLSSDGMVDGELLEIAPTDQDAVALLRKLDEYEGYNATETDQSEFLRRYVMLEKPRAGAWVYVLNRDPLQNGFTKIQSGSWRSFKKDRFRN